MTQIQRLMRKKKESIMFKRIFSTSVVLSILVACGNGPSALSSTTQSTAISRENLLEMQEKDTVAFVDINKYVGLWYEIASIPQSFQSFCQFTTAEYRILAPGQISVANKCRVGFVPISIFGEATVIDKSSNAILEVSFNNVSRKGDYRIVALADDYSYALVTNAARSSLFVLSRTNQLDDATYSSLLQRAAEVGVDISQVKKTKQE
jgi:apolipoprotein D and lipocalin family protein